MNEFDGAGDFRAVGETLPQPVFHRLDVVIGGALDGFDALGIREGKLISHRCEQRSRRMRKRRKFRDATLVGERFQPCELDPYSLPDEAIFAEPCRELRHFAAIASVKRGQCSQRCQRVCVRH